MSWILLTLFFMSLSYKSFAAGDTNTGGPSCNDNQVSSICHCGIPGMHGKPGSPGFPGRDGRDGRDGLKGDRGQTGAAGVQGPPGQKGERGETEASGASGVMPFENWKECGWNNLNDGRDNGLIKDCVFTKNFSDTALHVAWTGTLRVTSCTNCCRRWYFTFNGAECSAPLPIDGIVYLALGGQNPHRVRHIEGHCNNIHKGKVRVGFWVGNCPSYGNANANTGFNAVSRIFVEEVSKPQA
ncbi:collagen triple helix repeat-containing protein 1-like [Montipora capricornis]|uniref:collagen triple helix repeat-containing protein 1-like n=1 Tax=Montipora capricornis TaxID=246305 RepID=UPI0035F171E2